MNLYLQNITEQFNLNNIPSDWQNIDFEKFSNNKILFDYQQKALENALKALYLFYNEDKTNKSEFFKRFQNNGLTEDLSYNIKKESKTVKYLLNYDKDYPVEDDKISFEYFINRMSFWMATGSGKTLVIVKLIELLAYLIEQNKIPKKDILFLTYRDDLIDQFKKHINEFNQSNPSIHINLYELKEYASKKQNPTLSFGHTIDVFIYRSDLISDEQKDKIVDYKNYDNNGNWYIILDEAHKGDREDSKRQTFYSILSRNGFMFNFSATFTDEKDYATCVYNFNLAQFVENGYGKHIYVSQQDVSNLGKKDDFNESEKQKILFKIFVLQTAIIKQYEDVKKVDEFLYHKPLLLTLVNSVNTDDSDLELFFREIEKIASNQIDQSLFAAAKDELKKDISNGKFEFEEKIIDSKLANEIDKINSSELLQYILNSRTNGKIEVIKIPGNKQELIFKLQTSERPFALMKIGDITEWIKNKLTGYEIIEKFENESIFRNLNENDDINILMGSRSFYEGWDSNRPNIILFINIGKGTDAKKFVLQSIGRGVRIEPVPNKRKRAQFLYNNKEIDETTYNQIKDKIEPLESLFVYGTKAENLKEVLDTLKQEKPEILLGNLFEINPDVKDKQLLIPTYQNSNQLIIEERETIKFPIHPDDYLEVKNYFNYICDKIALCKYDCNIKVLSKIKEGFNGKANNYFLVDTNISSIKKPELLLSLIFKYFANTTKELSEFKQLQEEIIHFKRIQISQEKLNSLQEKIENVKKGKDKERLENELDEKFDKGLITKDVYKLQIKNIEASGIKEAEVLYSSNEKLKIKLFINHYYIPLMLSETDKADYIQHIIKTKSERDFINELDNYLQKEENCFKNYDWWFFSKIDETLDTVYIPYYNPKTNRIDKFKPDFIFWLKKGKDYKIIFVDPKSSIYTDANFKIDWYKRYFEEKNNIKKFENNKDNLIKSVYLIMWGRNNTGREYERYWFDNFVDFAGKISLS